VFCNETMALNNTVTISQTVSDALGLSSLSTAGQVAAVTGYTAGVGLLVGGTYYMVSQYMATSALRSGAAQLLVSKQTEETSTKEQQKQQERRKKKYNRAVQQNRSRLRQYNESMPLIHTTPDIG
jgi:hypothetical protein